MHDRQEKVDGLYRQMLDAAQRPRITFGPIDLRDEITLPAGTRASRVDDEHTCPDCGARASVDIHDPMRGRIHLSCDSCFKMWQLRVAVDRLIPTNRSCATESPQTRTGAQPPNIASHCSTLRGRNTKLCWRVSPIGADGSAEYR